MSLSKNKIKYIQSLKNKKFRNQYGTFIAEGDKLVSELLECMDCQLLVGTKEFLQINSLSNVPEIIEVREEELQRVSLQKTPQQALAVFFQPRYNIQIEEIQDNLTLALDGIQDPGNLGTIIRLADWYGIKNIVCSSDTADIFNPKVVQATMGAIARVKIHYLDLQDFLKKNTEIPIYGTFLDGKNIYEEELTQNGIIVMGNEGSGIRPEIKEIIYKKLYLPPYPIGESGSESLNVAIATAIVCAEFRRRSF